MDNTKFTGSLSLKDKREFTLEVVRKAIKKLDGWGSNRISYSSYRNYKMCMLKGVISSTYVLPRIEKPILVQNFRGQVIHNIFDRVLEASRKDPTLLLSQDAFLESVTVSWNVCVREHPNVAWENDSQKVQTRREIEDNIIRSYPLLRESSDGTRILRLLYENDFTTEGKLFVRMGDGIELTGRSDLLIHVPGQHVGVDYKDGKKENTDWRQLGFYGASELIQGNAFKGGFLFTALGEWAWKKFDEKRWQQLRGDISLVVEQIRERKFPATYNQHMCPYCDYTGFCIDYQMKSGLRKVYKEERGEQDGLLEL